MSASTRTECLSNIVTFNASKKELLTFDNLKKCCRRLVCMGYRVATNTGIISSKMLAETKIFVMLCPTEKLKAVEKKALKQYIKRGGRLLITSNDGEKISDINKFLKEYGIKFRNDAVVRMHRWSDYHYPKESVVTDGVVNEAIYTMQQNSCGDIKEHKNFQYLYPYGCTLDVDKSSIILLSTGTACFPFNRPTCAFYRDSHTNCRLIAFGSTMALSDSYFHKEENSKLFKILFGILSESDVELNTADVLCPDVTDYNALPDIGKLAEVPYSCLQENEEILSKSAIILKAQLHQFDNRCVAKVLSTYKELGMVPEKLQIIKPKFETPLPELKASVIPPRFRGIPNPALELMDLDDFFISPNAKLDQLSNKCSDSDLEYYIAEFGKIVQVPSHVKNGKQILEFICSQMVNLKRNYFN
ncbi:intraflagellar transport protein 52 homolog [Caerostris darwini]|uniref:Intraflagellar transport protein 52 homolog n=1 Tax=Caerostris darwini TaxID=1538125 RepID=A0AAV4RSI9_9ARAC|nr:intraflagellar transport protein 52 homolog [Caerostris darwini]